MSFGKNSKWYAAAMVLVGIVVGVGLVSAGTSVVHWSGTNQFCGTFCHSMDAAYASYQKGLHAKTNSGYNVDCVDCHLKYRPKKDYSQAEVVGMLWHKATSGANSLWGEIRGTLDTPEKQIEHRAEMAEAVTEWMKETGFVNCRSCHDMANFKENPAKPMVSAMHKAMADNKETNCLSCHVNAGHQY